MSKLNLTLFTLLLCLIGHTSKAQQTNVQSLDSTIQHIFDAHQVPGAMVAVLTKDSIILEQYIGLADVNLQQPVTDSSIFALGSVSKTFLAAAAMIAYERGELDIHAPIKELAPNLTFENNWAGTSPVRFIHLLEHTSGFDEAHFNLTALANSNTPFEEVMKHAEKSLITRWKPGDHYEYSTLGYIVAAYILEEALGQSFEAFMQRTLLNPMQMNRATYRPSSAKHFAKGHESIDSEVPFPDIPQWPAGNLSTTLRSMIHFTSMLLNNGLFNGQQVINSSTLQIMETPESSLLAQGKVSLGYGKGLTITSERGHKLYSHSGRIGGFLSDFGYTRQGNLGYVILTNSVNSQQAIKKIKAAIFSKYLQHETNTDRSGNTLPDWTKNVTGCYQPITSIPQLGKKGYFIYRLIDMPVINETDGQLFISGMLGGDEPLIHVSDSLFRRTHQSLASSRFTQDDEGDILWLDSEASYKKIPLWWGYTQFYLALISLASIIVAFLLLLVWIPIRLLRRNMHHIHLQLIPFLAICAFLIMIISFILAFDPEKLYSAGAILFFIFGLVFIALSYLGLAKSISAIYKKVKVSRWVLFQSLFISMACCLVSTYLLSWEIIGLTLWDY